MGVYLRAKFEVSSIILTGNFTPAPLTAQNEPLKSPPRLGLTEQLFFSHDFLFEILWFRKITDQKY